MNCTWNSVKNCKRETTDHFCQYTFPSGKNVLHLFFHISQHHFHHYRIIDFDREKKNLSNKLYSFPEHVPYQTLHGRRRGRFTCVTQPICLYLRVGNSAYTTTYAVQWLFLEVIPAFSHHSYIPSSMLNLRQYYSLMMVVCMTIHKYKMIKKKTKKTHKILVYVQSTCTIPVMSYLVNSYYVSFVVLLKENMSIRSNKIIQVYFTAYMTCGSVWFLNVMVDFVSNNYKNRTQDESCSINLSQVQKMEIITLPLKQEGAICRTRHYYFKTCFYSYCVRPACHGSWFWTQHWAGHILLLASKFHFSFLCFG